MSEWLEIYEDGELPIPKKRYLGALFGEGGSNNKDIFIREGDTFYQGVGVYENITDISIDLPADSVLLFEHVLRFLAMTFNNTTRRDFELRYNVPTGAYLYHYNENSGMWPVPNPYIHQLQPTIYAKDVIYPFYPVATDMRTHVLLNGSNAGTFTLSVAKTGGNWVAGEALSLLPSSYLSGKLLTI